MAVVVVDDMAVGVSSVTMGGVAMEGCIDYVGGMVWVAVDNRAMSNAMNDSMINDRMSMSESVRVTASDGQPVIDVGGGGRAGSIMSLEVVLFMEMIFGAVIVEDSVVVSLVMNVVVILLDVFVMIVNMIVDIVDVLVQVGVVMMVSGKVNDVVVDVFVAFI